jgi:hypothetical protein
VKPVVRILEEQQVKWMTGQNFNVLTYREAWELATELRAACLKKKENEHLTDKKTFIIISL